MNSTEKTVNIIWHVLIAMLVICQGNMIGVQGTQTGEQYQYDAQGRLTRVSYSDGSSITYTYDKNGNLLSIMSARMNAKAEPSNQPPSAGSPTMSPDAGISSRAIRPAAPEADVGEARTYSIVTKAAHGTASVVDNQLVYTPKAGFHGRDSFTFRATDRNDVGVNGIAQVTVKAAKDAQPGVQDAVTPPAKGMSSPSDKRPGRRW